MHKAKGREFWERVAREVAAGATRSSVAARYGVAGSTVGHWVRRLEEEQAAKPTATLVPVRITGEPRRRVAIAVGATRVEFEEGTDPAYVAAVVRVLASC